MPKPTAHNTPKPEPTRPQRGVRAPKPPATKVVAPRVGITSPYDRAAVMERVLPLLEGGLSLSQALRSADDLPTIEVILRWVREDEELSKRYASARQLGYLALSEKLTELAAETNAYTLVPDADIDGRPLYDENGEQVLRKVLVPLSPDVLASKRLQIDTLKWQLSKMLPKIYGDKVTQEHVGANGGPIQTTNMDLRGLSDSELEQMQTLMAKAAGAKP